ncbi:ISNCY family transposase [Candidatus Pantoea alvi]|uniref:Rpn family recombination-promoting nuclease/putative transposase n=1 Tax=Enterobacter agglomerans TaxID=549 RepID=UPI000CDD7C55|nr:Rpn family recombination-promoting nuclease/putative transposase [Pantoea agglomerans]POW60823.1 ISNCY family transposase [Pantoea alvi]UBN53979.1 Rpn family recombination-promoting nuclease/putative transposase [Pantoea agglomerans]
MKKKTTPTPHDAVFRQLLSQPDVARDFMEIHLPPQLLALCDLSTLRLASGSFVEDDLRPYFSDVLYSMKTRSGDDGYLQVLIEHQSTPDKQMAFRLLRYAVAAMKRHLDAGHKKLPLVIPVLFYAGQRSPYPWSTCWLDGFGDPVLAAAVYGKAFPLVDVTVIPDEEIVQHRRMAALTLLQKHIRQRDLAEVIDLLVSALQADESSSQTLSLVNYIIQAGETTDAGAFVRELAQRMPQQEDALMTIAEQLKQEGRKEGEIQGKLEGMLEGKREVARSLLKMKLPREAILQATGLKEEDLARISVN